jgi:hypothetical protein
MGSETEQQETSQLIKKKAKPPRVAFRIKFRPPISAERTDGAARAANMLPAPTRVNSRRLGFMCLLLRYWWSTAVDWKRTEMITPRHAGNPRPQAAEPFRYCRPTTARLSVSSASQYLYVKVPGRAICQTVWGVSAMVAPGVTSKTEISLGKFLMSRSV